MSNAILLATLDELHQHWQRQSILPVLNPTADVVAIAKRNGVSLPADFAALYQRANGMALTGYQDVDEEGFHFPARRSASLRAARVIGVFRAGAEGMERVATTLTVFVDYMHTSWDYGFIPTVSGTGYEIGFRAALGEFMLITTSLATFLNLYMEDALVPHDYRIPYRSVVPEPEGTQG